MATAEILARDFWSALCQHDSGRAASLVADGAAFQLAGMSPARGNDAVETYLAVAGEALGAELETIALYDKMIILERVARVPGDPAGRAHVIVSLARVNNDRITSWQDFFDPAAGAECADARARHAGEPKQALAR